MDTHHITDTILIIQSSDLEDVLILNENYKRLANDLPVGNERTQYIKLCTLTSRRIKELSL